MLMLLIDKKIFIKLEIKKIQYAHPNEIWYKCKTNNCYLITYSHLDELPSINFASAFCSVKRTFNDPVISIINDD